jgi:hypothetical protein
MSLWLQIYQACCLIKFGVIITMTPQFKSYFEEAKRTIIIIADNLAM